MRKYALACLLTVATAATALAGQLTIINSSDYGIHELYISPTSQRNWGSDQLGTGTIGRAERFTVRNIPDGTYDLKIVNEDHEECIVNGVDVSGEMSWTLTDTVIESCVKK